MKVLNKNYFDIDPEVRLEVVRLFNELRIHDMLPPHINREAQRLAELFTAVTHDTILDAPIHPSALFSVMASFLNTLHETSEETPGISVLGSEKRQEILRLWGVMVDLAMKASAVERFKEQEESRAIRS